MTPPSIWVVTPELHRHGGTERSVAEELTRLGSRYRLRVYALEREIELERIDVTQVPSIGGPHLFRFMWWLVANRSRRAWDAFRDGGPALVYASGINCLDADVVGVHVLFGDLLARGRRTVGLRSIPRRVHQHLYWRLLRTLERLIYSGSCTLWTISDETARRLEEQFHRPAGSVETVRYGVDTATFSPESRSSRRDSARRELQVDGFLVGVVGNDVDVKGIDTAIDALRYLEDDISLAVIGNAPETEIRSLARRSSVQDRVRIWPHDPDVVRYYAAIDLLLAPSRQDAFNLPVLEAMACGLLVAASRRCGVTEIIPGDLQDVIIDRPDEPEEVARVVRSVSQEQDRSLPARLRHLAERHTWSIHADDVATVIDRELTTPRVLVLSADPSEKGGVGRSTRTLLTALSERFGDDRVGHLSVWNGSERTRGRLLHPGRRADPPGTVSGRHAMSFALSATRRAIRWRRNLVIIAAHPHLAPVARLLSLMTGRPFVVWAHGYEVWGPTSWAVGHALEKADHVWAVSGFTAQQLARHGRVRKAQLRVLQHGLPLELPSAERSDRQPVVLTVARLTEDNQYKGVDTLIRAWPTVVKQNAEATLRVVGDGDDRPRLEALARSSDVDRSVLFLGQVSDEQLAQEYSRARVFALPGRASLGHRPGGEGFGLVFIEAAAAGLPVVAGRAGGAVEAVRDGRTGLLVDPSSTSDVAEALTELLGDRVLAAEMGNAGMRWVRENFSYERFERDVTRLVGELMGSTGDGS